MLAFPSSGFVPTGTAMKDLTDTPPPGVGPYHVIDVVPDKSWVGEIKKAATGTSGVRHDWRAAQFLGSLHDPRFSSRPETNITVNNQTAVTTGLGGLDALAKLVNGVSVMAQRKAM